MQINSYQQYTLTGSNNLASLLAKILDNLQESLKPGKGNGGGSNFQLPDIIQSQGDLEKQLSQLGKGKKRGSEEGENPKSDADGKKGNGSSTSEKELEEIYEVYKEQSRIRQLLEKQLENVLSEFERLKTKDILREMEDLENSILNNGINQATMQQAARIQNELLKLKEATLQQGEGENRISNTNYENFGTNKSITPLDSIENATPQIEILNRQPLPLRLKYKDKVKVYFSKDD
jgi:RecG-like helicase